MNMPNLKALQEVEALEEQLQAVKWTLSAPAMRLHEASRIAGIVSRTAGLLGKRVPRGVLYEKRLRRRWRSRSQRRG